MADFTMPSLGADMDEGTLVEWLVGPGDTVTKGDVVAVVETAKSTIEVECFDSGTVGALLVDPGTTVPVGTRMAVINTGTEPPAAVPAPAPAPAKQPTAPASELRAATGSTTTAAGDTVSSPLVRHLAEQKGIDLSSVHGSGKGGRITRSDVEHAPTEGPHRVKASPLARRLARSAGVDLGALRGTGQGGTIRADDVRAATAGPPAHAVQSEPARPSSATAEPAAPARAAISALMSRANREIPHYYLSTKIDLAVAMAWMRDRNASRPVAERFVPAALLLKSVALAARQVPELNGYWKDGAFVPSHTLRLGVAVSLRGGGLVAPALTDADTMPLPELMATLKGLVSRARGGRLRASETADPTLTVTNLGDQGVEAVFGVIYPPQVALVGLGRVIEQPVAVNGMLTVHPTVTATLCADHRASDGATGARFLTSIDRLLQRPEEL
ncbi:MULTISPECIES: dihydrolipoamide acetyltransferase family protein [Streptomyces]|uniref:Dihydrolipoamide acetyltransferase component of pyruvate dehydrogenase complex n=1 Tax=Streptomyces spororaveus TaxID=284039 RepID=A0ABQ3TQN7_9ACTN|nr:dihydrolipoamide acetyltransferase family protein [Streptomyces spororaveus]GHI82352.1 acetyltransferase component of pyruvate dehydrogenase complex [Streptomyces spororaveus]